MKYFSQILLIPLQEGCSYIGVLNRNPNSKYPKEIRLDSLVIH